MLKVRRADCGSPGGQTQPGPPWPWGREPERSGTKAVLSLPLFLPPSPRPLSPETLSLLHVDSSVLLAPEFPRPQLNLHVWLAVSSSPGSSEGDSDWSRLGEVASMVRPPPAGNFEVGELQRV